MLKPYEKITLPDKTVLEVRAEDDNLIIPIIIPPSHPNGQYDITEIKIRGDLIRQLVDNKKV